MSLLLSPAPAPAPAPPIECFSTLLFSTGYSRSAFLHNQTPKIPFLPLSLSSSLLYKAVSTVLSFLSLYYHPNSIPSLSLSTTRKILNEREILKVRKKKSTTADPHHHHHHQHLPSWIIIQIYMELLDYCEAEKSSSLGFMELLSMQDFGPSVFDILQGTLTPSVDVQVQVEPLLQHDSPEVFLNAPTTPNSSSISSESTAGQNDEQTKEVVDGEEEEEEEEEENHRIKKLLKPKKTASQKRQREPRFAFMTKSEVDHLEDGYRWRKYGQKAVKNSPFPRSYYRCTTASCNVKKRVERSCSDPTIVVTTYEGQHTHPSPVMPLSSAAVHALPPYSGFSGPDGAGAPSAEMILQQHFNYSVLLNCGYAHAGPTNTTVSSGGGGAQNLRFCSQSSALLTDHGLLQDVVPWSAIKKEE